MTKRLNNLKKFDLDEVKTLNSLVLIIEDFSFLKLEDIFQIFYLSDFRHLNYYGRTISGCKYQKNNDIVSSNDILEVIQKYDNIFKMDEGGKVSIVASNAVIDLDELSKSDIKVLLHSVGLYRNRTIVTNVFKMSFPLLEECETIDYYDIISKMDCSESLIEYIINPC